MKLGRNLVWAVSLTVCFVSWWGLSRAPSEGVLKPGVTPEDANAASEQVVHSEQVVYSEVRTTVSEEVLTPDNPGSSEFLLTVKVLDWSGNPISDVQVFRTSDSKNPVVLGVTDAVGFFELTTTPGLSSTLRFTRDGYYELEQKVLLSQRELTLTLRRPKRIQGRVSKAVLSNDDSRDTAANWSKKHHMSIGDALPNASVLLMHDGLRISPEQLAEALKGGSKEGLPGNSMQKADAAGLFDFKNLNPYYDYVVVAGGEGFVSLSPYSNAGPSGFERSASRESKQVEVLVAPLYGAFLSLVDAKDGRALDKGTGQVGVGGNAAVPTEAVMLDKLRFVLAGGDWAQLEENRDSALVALTPLRPGGSEDKIAAYFSASLPGYQRLNFDFSVTPLSKSIPEYKVALESLGLDRGKLTLYIIGLDFDLLELSSKRRSLDLQFKRRSAKRTEMPYQFSAADSGNGEIVIESVPYRRDEEFSIEARFGEYRFPREGWLSGKDIFDENGEGNVVVEFGDCGGIDFDWRSAEGTLNRRQLSLSIYKKGSAPKSLNAINGPHYIVYPLPQGEYSINTMESSEADMNALVEPAMLTRIDLKLK